MAYAYYTGMHDKKQGDGDVTNLPRKYRCNTRCAVSKCPNNIEEIRIGKVNEYRAKQHQDRGDDVNFRPVICDSCFAKITKETTTLPGPDGGKFERTKGRNGKFANYKLTPMTTKAAAIKIKKKHPNGDDTDEGNKETIDAQTLQFIRDFVTGKEQMKPTPSMKHVSFASNDTTPQTTTTTEAMPKNAPRPITNLLEVTTPKLRRRDLNILTKFNTSHIMG